MRLAPEANAFQQLPRGGIPQIAFGIGPMCAFLESASDDRGKGFGCATLSLVVFVSDIADFFCGKVSGSAINVADHFPGIRQYDGIKLLGTQALPKMLSAVIIGDSRIAFKFIIFKLRQEFKQIIVVGLPESTQEQPGCFDFFTHESQKLL